MCKKSIIKIYLILSVACHLSAWQDDSNVFLRHPFESFKNEDSLPIFSHAQAEVRLGRYLSADTNHAWRGGLLGEVTMWRFSDSGSWYMSLNMETLADDHNDINFRLIQVYYEALTGVKYILGPGMLNFAYRHRCSHGADRAVAGRILIRSGLKISYDYVWQYPNISLLVSPEGNIYIFGQNQDLQNQARGNLGLASRLSWYIIRPFYMVLGAGYGMELLAASNKRVFTVGVPITNTKFRSFVGVLVGLGFKNTHVRGENSLHFAKNIDSGLGPRSLATWAFSYSLNFYF